MDEWSLLSLIPAMASFLLTLCWTWSPPRGLACSPPGLLPMMDRHPSIRKVIGASFTEIVGFLPDLVW